MSETRKTVRKREVPAVSRAVAILRQLGRSDDPVGVNQLARDLGIVPSTCLHILRVLQDEGLVAMDPESKRYTIGLGVLSLARAALRRNAFPALIQPRLTELSDQFGMTCIATQMIDTWHMIVVALSQSNLPFQLQVDLGSRFPALISATGRCFAAFNQIPRAELETRFNRLSWDHPPAFDIWLQEVAQVRETGFAVDAGSYISGVTVVAVPFLDEAGHMTRSMVAIGISERVRETGIDTIAQALLGVRDDVARLQPGMT
ncbi:IclR family transcriptional regulator [Alkalilacustris brevis]|uniref:IclR family transcriptional regulator n=1 Tax=Alkalilacustris brevis TaxID=2026338 RepID=UPI000E0DAE1E|nr:IclR family transcriptional regulator [Alkalilacustris brevis]